MGESMADLAVALQQVSRSKNGLMGFLYVTHWEQAAPEHESRWREYATAGLMALARWIAPLAYDTRLHRGSDLAGAGAGSV